MIATNAESHNEIFKVYYSLVDKASKHEERISTLQNEVKALHIAILQIAQMMQETFEFSRGVASLKPGKKNGASIATLAKSILNTKRKLVAEAKRMSDESNKTAIVVGNIRRALAIGTATHPGYVASNISCRSVESKLSLVRALSYALGDLENVNNEIVKESNQIVLNMSKFSANAERRMRAVIGAIK